MNNGQLETLNHIFATPDNVTKYFEHTGLAGLFTSGAVANLVDYVFGVEAGLDSNARKNRSGLQMQNAVAKCFTAAGLDFDQQVQSIKIPPISQALGKDQKVFDFRLRSGQRVYLVEVNFYSTGGSKLNEAARS